MVDKLIGYIHTHAVTDNELENNKKPIINTQQQHSMMGSGSNNIPKLSNYRKRHRESDQSKESQ